VKLRIGLIAVAILLAGAALRGWDLARRRAELLSAAASRAANVTLLLSGYVHESFAAADASLRQLALHGRRIGGAPAPADEWLPSLRTARAGVPAIGAVTVVDAAGIIRHSTQPSIVGQSRRDDYMVRRLLSDTADALVAGRPFRTVAGRPGYIIPLGRRMTAADGRLLGLVVTSFELDSARRFLRSADLGREGMVWVFHPEGVVLIREPSEGDPMGEAALGHPVFEAGRLATAGSTAVRTRLTPDGPMLTAGWRRIDDPPLMVAAALSEHELLGEWRRELWISTGVFLLLSLAVAGALAALFRQMDVRRAHDAALARNQRLASLGELTGGVAHDFNNLLTVILGNVSLLKRRPGTRMQDELSEIEQATHRAADLTRSLLAFARRQQLRPALLDLNEIVEGVQPMLRRLLGEEITVTLRLARNGCLAVVDATQLETALVNLCVNARDAMPAGGLLVLETGHAELTRDYARHNEEVTPGRYALVSVSDTGQGIRPEHLSRIFEPFFTTKGVGKGTGLGLSMVYGFVRQSGGHIKAYTEAGHGATFKLYFPEAAGTPAPAPPARVQAGRARGEVVLLVEDELQVRTLATRLLEDLGYLVVSATDGPSALATAAPLPRIDVLVTDVMLPGGMSGRQVAEAIGALRPGLPIVYMSGYPEDILAHRAQVGPDPRLIPKPFDREQLADAVRAALAEAGAA
jgi:signal transduction histidine kinase/ActR/RegA family two-component response regulator